MIRNVTVQSGERTSEAGKPVRNKILLSIPTQEFRAIRSSLEYCSFPSHLILHEPTDTLKFVYFLNAGLISLIVPMEDGQTVEAGVVGNEGAAGVPIAVGLVRSPTREIVQISGDGFRVTAVAMFKILKSTPRFQMMLSRYTVVQGMQVAQTVACNRLHLIEKRLARWLLMAQDRVDSALHDPRFPRHDVGGDSTQCKLCSRHLTEAWSYRIYTGCPNDCEPPETEILRL
jgi:hypothetical protein